MSDRAERKLKVIPRASGGRPAKISRERIIEVARRLGPGELTFPRIASRLGVRPPALYYHFNSRNDLLNAIALELSKEFHLEAGEPDRWQPWLEATVMHFYDLLLANPVLFEVGNWRGLAMFGLPFLETVLTTLEGAGYTLEQAGRTWDVVSNLAYSEARLLSEIGKSSPMPVILDPEQLAGRPIPRCREWAAMGSQNPRERLALTLHWLITALPQPRARARTQVRARRSPARRR